MQHNRLSYDNALWCILQIIILFEVINRSTAWSIRAHKEKIHAGLCAANMNAAQKRHSATNFFARTPCISIFLSLSSFCWSWLYCRCLCQYALLILLPSLSWEMMQCSPASLLDLTHGNKCGGSAAAVWLTACCSPIPYSLLHPIITIIICIDMLLILISKDNLEILVKTVHDVLGGSHIRKSGMNS